MNTALTRERALEALKKYNREPFHILHALTVEGVMRWFAQDQGYGEETDFWGTAGLLHDIDFEMYPEQHCVKAPELLKEAKEEHQKRLKGGKYECPIPKGVKPRIISAKK